MRTWTPDAAEYFESWLGRVRTSLRSDPGVDPDDVTQDLRAHVHAELEAGDEPVTVGSLSRVLDGLGQPTDWSDSVVHSGRRRIKRDWFERNVADTLVHWQKRLGGDLGLPALLFPLTLLGLYGFEDGGFVLLAVAYFVARGQVMYVPDALVGRKKWLVYFPLAAGSGLLVGLVLGFPGTFETAPGNTFQVLWMLGAWWIAVGFIAAREPKRVRAILRPFADSFEPSHGRMLSLLGAAFLIASTVVMMNGNF